MQTKFVIPFQMNIETLKEEVKEDVKEGVIFIVKILLGYGAVILLDPPHITIIFSQ